MLSYARPAILLMVFGITCLPADSVRAQDDPKQDALALARAMQVERSVKEAFEVVVESNIKTGRATRAELECITRVDMSFANDVYAAGLARALTQEEIKEAVDFFSKPTGQCFLKYSRDLDLQSRGLTASAPDTQMSEEMYADLAKFMGGAASKKTAPKRRYLQGGPRRQLRSAGILGRGEGPWY